jgi:hypothetical protein
MGAPTEPLLDADTPGAAEGLRSRKRQKMIDPAALKDAAGFEDAMLFRAAWGSIPNLIF